MSTPELDPLMAEIQRRALITVIRAHPDWKLKPLLAYQGPYAAAIGRLTIRDLLDTSVTIDLPPDGGPPICPSLLARAQRTTGARYDRLIHRVLADAHGPVQAAYIEARVGGPRWKRQASLRRLEVAGLIERRGITSATTYSAVHDG